jgi:hypothetical protein
MRIFWVVDFSRAAGPQEPKDLSGLYLEGQIFDGGFAGSVFGEG